MKKPYSNIKKIILKKGVKGKWYSENSRLLIYAKKKGAKIEIMDMLGKHHQVNIKPKR